MAKTTGCRPWHLNNSIVRSSQLSRIPTAYQGDEQVQPVPVVELPRLVAGLGVLDFLNSEHLGVFSVGAFFVPPKIPPVKR